MDYRCKRCGRAFNLFTGTALRGTQRPRSHAVLLVRGIAQGAPTGQLAREPRCDTKHLLELRHRPQALAEQAAGRESGRVYLGVVTRTTTRPTWSRASAGA